MQKINGYLAGYVLIFLLVGAGLWFTVRTGCVQRYLGVGLKSIFGNMSLKAGKQESGMNSFQAVAIAAQVGTGNIGGASGAILTGGPVYYITTFIKGGFGRFLAGFFAAAITIALGFFAAWSSPTPSA